MDEKRRPSMGERRKPVEVFRAIDFYSYGIAEDPERKCAAFIAGEVNHRLAPLVDALERWRNTRCLPDNLKTWDFAAECVQEEWEKLRPS